MYAKTSILLTAAKRWRAGAFAAMLLMPLLAHADMPTYPSVTTERLVNAQKDNGWLMYRRNYESTGYAPFDQINAGNVGQLVYEEAEKSRVPLRYYGK